MDFFEVLHKTQIQLYCSKYIIFQATYYWEYAREKCVCTGNLRINSIHNKYVQGKGNCEILGFLSMLCVKCFVHTRECDPSSQVGMEHIC